MKPADYGKVGVLMGGWSAEREVSLNSGAAVLAGLRQAGVDAHGVDVGRDILEVLLAGDFDRVFNIVHGRGGEDGVLQGALEVMQLPYTGSGVLGCALSMDKIRCKQIWRAMGLPTEEFVVARSEAELLAAGKHLGWPVMVKPNREGSSIGMSRVDSADQITAAWQLAGELDQDVLVEKWITGAEYTAAFLGDRVLPMIRLETPRGFYDYDAKYRANDTLYHIPCGLGEEREQEYAGIVRQACAAVGAEGWGRMDFFVDDQGRMLLLEVNLVPGMTSHSLVPMAAKAAGMSFEELVLDILHTSTWSR